ncbi:MAG: hypothetical protein KAJ62_08555 [Desulfobacteraceae bacterium]|nr:hypothetical protein [Desulfobacteraceae bacterium]
MRTIEKKLIHIANNFRKAIEQADLSETAVGREGYLRMDEFPHGSCSEACTLLGIFLVEEIQINPLLERCGQIEDGNHWYGSHHWLEHNDIVIDIAADQFPMVDEPVIVSRKSLLHTQYAHDLGTITTKFALRYEPQWMITLYETIKITLNPEDRILDFNKSNAPGKPVI